MSALSFERSYWGDCANTFDEDQKHYVYGACMGLQLSRYNFNAGNKRVLDIGGGPTSMLLKTYNLTEGKVCDPLQFPQWTVGRYASRNIITQTIRGEDINESGWDEVWIYNVLQHVDDPAKIIANALKAGPVLRLFEWIDLPPYEGHPQTLTQNALEAWIGKPGKVSVFAGQNGCDGKAFYGQFSNET